MVTGVSEIRYYNTGLSVIGVNSPAISMGSLLWSWKLFRFLLCCGYESCVGTKILIVYNAGIVIRIGGSCGKGHVHDLKSIIGVDEQGTRNRNRRAVVRHGPCVRGDIGGCVHMGTIGPTRR